MSIRSLWRKFKRLFCKENISIPKPPIKEPILSGKFIETDSERLNNMYYDAVILEQWDNKVDEIVERILDNKNRYINASNSSGVPWEIIACIHSLEGGLRFNTILHNGERLPIKKTILVPKGRGPFNTWEAAASDALKMKKRYFPNNWSIGASLNFLEHYNGLGYRKYHTNVNTPYLWSATNKYTRGKYVRDGRYSSTAVSKQVGCVAILKKLNFQSE